MGFMGLGHWVASDNAADSMSQVIDSIVKQLKKEYEEEGNEFNTPGFINVALIMEDLLMDVHCYNENLVKFVMRVKKDLHDNRASFGKEFKPDFDRMIKSMDTIIANNS